MSLGVNGGLGGFTPLRTLSSESIAKATAALFFQDETAMLGENAGSEADSVGELVFTTSMTGFQESLSDPSYAGQILTFAYPLIGNYGVSESAFESLESKVWANGVVVKESCATPFHYASTKSLTELLREQNVPAIAGVDTRAIVKKTREHGVVPCALATWNGKLSQKEFEIKRDYLLKELSRFNYSQVNFVERTSGKQKQTFKAKNEKKRVALVDYGAKAGIVRELLKRNCSIIVFPHDASAEEILAENPDGIMLANGPGDPSLLKNEVKQVQKLVSEKPLFGICLGHQILACALGGKTFKLKFGHRGANHAVQNTETGKAFITSQNHGFAVDSQSLLKNAVETFVNCLDGTNEGLKHKDLPAFSIQFHPEANPGPYDANFFFEEFLRLLK